ncbi:hypothetical protein ACOMHN_006265 [Nucella lapillus]
MSDTESDYDPDNIGGSTSEESVHESEESSDSEDYSDEGDAASDECPACNIGLCPECFAQYHKKPRV